MMNSDNARCISVHVDLKTRILEPPPMAAMSMKNNDSEKDETLIGGDGTTLVGNGPRTKSSMNDRTLVGGRNDETLYGASDRTISSSSGPTSMSQQATSMSSPIKPAMGTSKLI
jgi:hypothetical protein